MLMSYSLIVQTEYNRFLWDVFLKHGSIDSTLTYSIFT